MLFFPNSSIPLGELTLFTELRSEVDELYANVSSILTIQDHARIQYYLNSTEYRQNETIHLEAYITLEDIHTVPVLCQVEFKDLTDGNVSLMNKSTNSYGYVSFTYSLPENITIVPLPAYSPELNPVENLWHYLRSHYWANRSYDNYDDLRYAAIDAWQNAALNPEIVESVCRASYAQRNN